MNALENYKTIAENIFGKGICTFNVDSNATNMIISSLASSEYSLFKKAFIARLERLSQIYGSNDDNRKIILRQINLIAQRNSTNWQGAYSELIALDYLNKDFLKEKLYLFSPIILNKEIENHRTYASMLGKTGKANLDGYFESGNIFFDIKSFKDNVNEILQEIFTRVKSKIADNNFSISAEYPSDISHDEIKMIKKDLINELVNGIDAAKKTKHLKSNTLSELSYRLLWGRGILISEKTYSPYKHAKENYKIVFKYLNKFVKDKPFFLVFVIFPWFNGVITDFSNQNRLFYRAFSRRVFCQNLNKKQKLNTILSKFRGNETIHEVSKKISGILFIEDHSIKNHHIDELNVQACFYINPNADNKLLDSFLKPYFKQLGNNEFDDFQYDNY